MSHSLNLIRAAAIAMLSLSMLTACNTVEGMGEDVSAAGNAVDDSAEKHKNY